MKDKVTIYMCCQQEVCICRQLGEKQNEKHTSTSAVPVRAAADTIEVLKVERVWENVA